MPPNDRYERESDDRTDRPDDAGDGPGRHDHVGDGPAAYDPIAERTDDLDDLAIPWADSPFQERFVWPAVRPLLPGVEGERVLDAGCGTGDYAGWFLERGAEVVGLDASESALATARDRFGDRADFHHHDLSDPLPLDDDAFDLVFSNLVLSHVADWRPAFREFGRVLAPGGVLVFSTMHPVETARRAQEEAEADGDDPHSYHEPASWANDWAGAAVPTHHRPLSAVVAALADAGFRLERFDEPTPDPAFEDHAPDRYERAMERPVVACVKARSDPARD